MGSCRFFDKVIQIRPKLFSRVRTCQKTSKQYCSSRRALFFVPGSISNLVTSAQNLKVDSIVLDCEIGKAPDQKDEARQNIKNLLDSGPIGADNPELCVKINPIQTPEVCEADITALLSARNLPNSICLPKLKNVNQLQWVSGSLKKITLMKLEKMMKFNSKFTEKVWKALLLRPEYDRGPIKLIMHIDSGIAMLGLPELCKKAEDLATMAPVIPVALVFDYNSLVESIGGRKTQSGIEVLYARQKLVLIAKAFGLQAIDKPYDKAHNLKGLKESCLDGVILGYTGKQVTHIDHIVIVQEEFTPSRSKIHWAKAVLKEFRENQEKQQEDFGFDNSLIDYPTLKQAESIIKAAMAAGIEIESKRVKNHENQDEFSLKE